MYISWHVPQFSMIDVMLNTEYITRGLGYTEALN